MSQITYFDNVVPTTERMNIFKFCQSSMYQLGWYDSDDPAKFIPNLHSQWSDTDVENSQLLPYIQNCIDQTPWFTKKKIDMTVVNMVRSNDVHTIHHHKMSQVALYYVNLDWRDGWYGETIFYDELDQNKIDFTSPYIPGRIILFDGKIPHAIRPQSVDGPKFRITLSFFYES